MKYGINVPNNQARGSSIAGIIHNLDENFKNQLRNDLINPKPLLICGGGTSSRCASNDHWTVDLRNNFNFINIDLNTSIAEIGGGITMGKLINELSNFNKSFPIGLSGLTGIGYILTGGISPLSRSEGLAIDRIVEFEGIWGNGDDFRITKPQNIASSKEQLLWKALCGAAPFLGIITKLKVVIENEDPLIIWKGKLNRKQLIEAIKISETWSKYSSLQWTWGESINAYAVFKANRKSSALDLKKLDNLLSNDLNQNLYKVSGLSKMPLFNSMGNNDYYSEVIGLLSHSWGDNSSEIISKIAKLIELRPNSMCCISSQQLGELTNCNSKNQTSFIHRNSMWKPWVTASWPPNDQEARDQCLSWIKLAWESLDPYCLGIHLAQMHQHLDWNQKESQAAFGDWLNGLKELKKQYDPCGLLPSFL